MTVATIEAEIKEAAEKIGVEADQLAHAIREGLKDLLGLAEKDKSAAQQLIKEAQPTSPVEETSVVEATPATTQAE